jgi:kojibiose phosphorylase
MNNRWGWPLKREWSIREEALDPDIIRFQEALLSLGNGFLGTRSMLEEGYPEAYPGTYLAGVYDKSGGQSYAIVNAPNPLVTEFFIDGRRLAADEMEVIKHRRYLDMRKAALYRRTLFTHDGSRFEYRSMRFFSMHDVHVGVVRVSLRCFDADASVVLRVGIDGTVRNEQHAVGGPRKHYRVMEASAPGDGLCYLEARTNDRGIVVGMAKALEFDPEVHETDPEVDMISDHDSTAIECSFQARRGEVYQFDQYLAIHTSRETEDEVRAACLRTLDGARATGVPALLSDQQECWEKKWQVADVHIDGDDEVQQSLRFSIYHLLISVAPQDIDASVAPKNLSGEWYQGHIFWDTEIFVLPFFVYTHPELARQLLMYRARRLEPAKARAAGLGYEGALWPWESADSGDEETPPTWINFNGSVLPVYNALREHHIACAIAYGLHFYYQHTGDDGFMLEHGLRMVWETARFWASRVSYDEARDQYEIKLVIGPNEFQEGVDNNSYTNAMTAWALRYAARLYHDFRESHPQRFREIVREMSLTDDEVGNWAGIAERIVFLQRSDGVIEEFEGYFDGLEVTISERDDHGMPIWPASVSISEAKETQLIKQADVVLLLYLLSDQFSDEVKRVNLDYYEPRTMHMSSLSMMSYAILAGELGEKEKAYQYLHNTVSGDLENLHGNTELGVHAAELGGAWQIVARGIAGVRAADGKLSVDPRLPEHWRSLGVHVWFRGNLVNLHVTQGTTMVSFVEGRGAVPLRVYGSDHLLEPNRTLYVER